MIRLTKSILILLTTLATFASGALNGGVLCLAASEDIAIERPHPDHDHSSHEHPDEQSGDENGDGCTDLGAGSTLVRDTAPSAYDHQHLHLPVQFVEVVTGAMGLSGHASRPIPNGPPSNSDLPSLRSIILVL